MNEKGTQKVGNVKIGNQANPCAAPINIMEVGDIDTAGNTNKGECQEGGNVEIGNVGYANDLIWKVYQVPWK